ncbi:MAG: AraC family transcriptional regulator, partial [Anaerovoracaceae bacterium]
MIYKFEGVTTIENQENNLVQQAVDMIETDFPLLAGVDDLADRLAVSKCHLIRSFTKKRGISPGKYLVQVRLLAVMAYLVEEEYTVETIAGLTGFSCGNYLSKVFRRATGLSPCTFRETAQKNTP